MAEQSPFWTEQEAPYPNPMPAQLAEIGAGGSAIMKLRFRVCFEK